MSEKVYQIITKRIIDALDEERVPWHMPWSSSLPTSLGTGKIYKGINTMLLSIMGEESKWWCTANEAHKRGGRIKDDEFKKGVPVVYWHFPPPKEDDNGEPVYRRPYPMFSTAYNERQVEGVEFPVTEKLAFNPIEQAEAILAKHPCPPLFYERKEGRCYYSPHWDKIIMQPKEDFDSVNDWYRTRFHEEGHAIGHPKRMNRKSIADMLEDPFGHTFGSFDYAEEELVAEIFTAMLSARAGIDTEYIHPNSLAYVQGWARVVKKNPAIVTHAASKAQKAVDYILGENTSDTGELVEST